MAARARRPLSQPSVVDAALRLVDRQGLDALSMRRLGAALRVEAMSLYKHVPNKAALLDLLAERVLGDVAPPPAASWDERLRHLARELRRVALAHPHVFPLVATRMPSSPRALAPLEALLGALREAGLTDPAALRHFWALLAYQTGALLSEMAARTDAGSPGHSVPAALDLARFPNLVRLGGVIGACDFGTEYENGLEIAIGAIHAAAAGGE